MAKGSKKTANGLLAVMDKYKVQALVSGSKYVLTEEIDEALSVLKVGTKEWDNDGVITKTVWAHCAIPGSDDEFVMAFGNKDFLELEEGDEVKIALYTHRETGERKFTIEEIL